MAFRVGWLGVAVGVLALTACEPTHEAALRPQPLLGQNQGQGGSGPAPAQKSFPVSTDPGAVAINTEQQAGSGGDQKAIEGLLGTATDQSVVVVTPERSIEVPISRETVVRLDQQLASPRGLPIGSRVQVALTQDGSGAAQLDATSQPPGMTLLTPKPINQQAQVEAIEAARKHGRH